MIQHNKSISEVSKWLCKEKSLNDINKTDRKKCNRYKKNNWQICSSVIEEKRKVTNEYVCLAKCWYSAGAYIRVFVHILPCLLARKKWRDKNMCRQVAKWDDLCKRHNNKTRTVSTAGDCHWYLLKNELFSLRREWMQLQCCFNANLFPLSFSLSLSFFFSFVVFFAFFFFSLLFLFDIIDSYLTSIFLWKLFPLLSLLIYSQLTRWCLTTQ